MSVHEMPPPNKADARPAGLAKEDPGYGWLQFAGLMLMLVGLLNFIEGIAAVDKSHTFAEDAKYMTGDLHTWGWVLVFVGIAQGATGLGVFYRNQIARWVGVGATGLNAIAQLLFIQAYPFWSLALFAVDILVIYGLIAYGGRSAHRA
jgi:hypothetical protein